MSWYVEWIISRHMDVRVLNSDRMILIDLSYMYKKCANDMKFIDTVGIHVYLLNVGWKTSIVRTGECMQLSSIR